MTHHGAPQSRVKIVYVIDSIARGGTELQLVGLIHRLDRKRFDPRLVTLRCGEDLGREADCAHTELDVRRLLSSQGLKELHRLRRLLRDERVGIVQTFFQDATLFGMVAARAANVPVRLIAFRDMGFWRTRSQEFGMRRVYPLATGFLANSEAVKSEACTRDRLSPSRWRVIYNGIDVDRYRFEAHPEPEVAVGIVGNLNRRVKRADLFLRAAARVSRRNAHVTWHVVGDGELRAEYEALASDLGIADRVVFAGRVVDVAGYLRKLAIGVSCSDSEGLSNAVLEYMLAGCAVVATAVGGNLEVVRHGETGLVVLPGDETALADAVMTLLRDIPTRLALARNARSMVEREFGWERCVTQHEAYYDQALIAANRAAGPH
jgi:glycosyltransferase involved in cell wall biosynthesis